MQTDHSLLRHLPNQTRVNRRIWKWVSILQGYDIDIQHIPGKMNPADAWTRQAKGSDDQYAGEVKQQDADWVQELRVGAQATDQEIQEKLNQLYTSAASSNGQFKCTGPCCSYSNALRDNQFQIRFVRLCWLLPQVPLKRLKRQKCNGCRSRCQKIHVHKYYSSSVTIQLAENCSDREENIDRRVVVDALHEENQGPRATLLEYHSTR